MGGSRHTDTIFVGELSRAAAILSPKSVLLHSLGMAVIGSVGEFQPEAGSFSAYVETMEMFFPANSVPNEHKVEVFRSLIGAKTFSLVRSLVPLHSLMNGRITS